MKPITAARSAGAALILATVFAASPGEALWPFAPSKPVAQAKIKERANEEFRQLLEDIEKNKKLQGDAKELVINHVNMTQSRFNERAAELKKPEYEDWEFDFLGQQVSKVLIPTIQDAVKAAAVMPMQDQVAALQDTVTDSKPRNDALIRTFAVGRNRDKIGMSLWRAEHPEGGEHRDRGEHRDGGVHEEGQILADGEHRGGKDMPEFDPSKLSDEDIERAIKRSEVVQLGLNVANDVAHPGTTPPPVPVPGGVVPAPKPGGGAASNAGGSGRPSSIEDIVRRIASSEGVSQLYASNGISALENRDFRKAFDMAGRALALDPRNRNALEVMNSAKGRADGMEAGASSWAAAKGAASSLGRAPGEAGSFGGASPSAEIASAALSGAARIASDQARAEATSALKLGDPQSAVAILSKALAENPANPALLNLRAQTYGRLGRWEDALKDAAAGLALAPGNMVLLNTKALAENRTHRYRDALATSEMMIAADPRNAWAFANRAHAWAGLGDRASMLADINRAAALDPRFQRAAEAASLLQLPSDADVMFLFPGEAAKAASAPSAAAPSGRGRSFSAVVGAGIVGGLLLALGLLSTVLAPLKDTVVSAFTRVNRTGPATQAVATAEPASVAGNVGGLIRGQYEISRQIGQGGMGTVYEGTDRSLGRRVAIKKMREELRVNARERDRFIIEAKTVASLHHPNIVDIYAIAEEGEDVYLVFEYVDGKTVHDLVQSKSRLDPAESVRVTRAMGEALTYAHAHGVIHRDMKPSNVMLASGGAIKVMDFGIARMAKDALTRYSMTNTVVGTPPYMAPEQEQGVVRKESDVYSLAICAYEMLTGKLPFIGIGAGMLMNKINMSYIPPSRAIAGLPEALDEVFLKAFQADPERRYRTPAEFVAALSTASDGAIRRQA